MDDTLATAKALADSNRLRVVAVLMEHEELCVCQITALLGLATATVSRHMTILHDARLLQSRKAGRWVFYRLSDAISPALREWLQDSLRHSEGVETDRATVQRILSCDPRTLCTCFKPQQRPGYPVTKSPPVEGPERKEDR